MGLEDRDYMRGSARGVSFNAGNLTATKILIAFNAVCFILAGFADRFLGAGWTYSVFELSWGALASGKIWTLLTYSFLHAGLLHILCNMMGLCFFGNVVERTLGTARFLKLYFAAALAGGALWLLSSVGTPDALVGASGAVMGVFAAFCLTYPPVPVTFLLFFVIPFSVKPLNMLKIAACFEIFGALYSLSGGGSDIAYAAHLGGIAAGFLCVRHWRFADNDIFGVLRFFGNRRSPDSKNGMFGCSGLKRSADSFSYRVNITDTKSAREEVDRILDKINASGFASLTPEERDTLNKAKDFLK